MGAGASFTGYLVLLTAMATMIPPIAVASKINCLTVLPPLLPCLGYLIGAGPQQPTHVCCSSALKVVNLAILSQENLQTACSCFAKAQSSAPFPINVDKAKEMTKLCKLPIDIPVSTTLNCKTLTLPKSPIAPDVSPAPAPAQAQAPAPVLG